MVKPSLGVIFHPQFPPETFVDYARRAEALGFDELWLWEDSFLAGALTSAALALAGTQHLKVGIGIMPVTVRNPLFIAMEITTLARLFPGRFLPGFGHGSAAWMKQIGAYPKSTMKAIEETVIAVRALLQGETVTMPGDQVHLDNVTMHLTPHKVPPLFIGAMREKTLRLAGRVGDGTILTEMSSPAYVRFAREQIAAGMAEGDRTKNHVVVYLHTIIGADGTARQKVRHALAPRFAWGSPLLEPLGIAAEAMKLYQDYGASGAAERIPEEWLDELSISGTPDQAAASFKRLAEAGADSIVLQPLENDPNCLDDCGRYLLPLLK
ncbi:MAG: LLM class flavin-dependent oxidoreductase [Chloroflexi bacterium]|nr:LLM class flavin-dependent oxidoreductase [Chloroflexota bacterium]MCI0580033.1 LLM class flavin-dependent oxidoreductase [Chloroflexota bacterium]MCI0646772.1 LLM class flavin-dependent oxidoreductase [Chloroflexota bacterium]MCI0730200.1 LLM class flavin-dependent oxidoreductase [Chloroflexota bacterium]